MSIQYIYTIQGYYNNQWEDETSEINRKEAIQRLKEYRDNMPQYSHRLIKQKAIIIGR
jgi:hypothetical protein